MARFISGSFALVVIAMAALVTLGCAEDTSSEGEYSGVVAALEEDPLPEEVPPPYVPTEPSPIVLEEPVLPPEPPWIVEGVGTHFEVSGGGYLDVALTSSEPIQVQLESVPSVITMNVEAAEGATSTQITLSGLEPTTTYYKYTDSFENLEELVTDETGTYAYTQDLSDSHLVFIQQTQSTIRLTTADGWSDPSVGTWDPATLTGTLTRDVSETIMIYRSDGITLDGAGFTVSGSDSYGIYAYASPNATIKNVNVDGFSYGLNIYVSDNATIESVNVRASSQGIFISDSYGVLVTDSTFSESRWGVQLFRGGGHTVSGNTISTEGISLGEIGVRLYGTRDNIVSGNTISSAGAGIYLLWSPGGAYWPPNTISDNNVDGGGSGSINVYASVGTEVTGNTIYNPNVYGGEAIHVWGASDDTTVRSNEVSSASIVFNGDGSRYIQGCTVDNNTFRGARLRIERAENCTVTNNTFDYASMWLDSVHDSTVADNAQWRSYDGIYVSGYSYRIKFERNTASDNSRTGITMTYTTGIMELTDNVAERNGTDGIVLYGPFNNALTGNLVADNGQSGLWLVNASDTPVLNTTALNNLVGIQLDGANNTEVSGSTVSGNDVGIYLYDYAQNNQVRDNRVSDNKWGIFFYLYADHNTVFDNTVCSSSEENLALQLSSYNTIFNNDFINESWRQVRSDRSNYLSADLPAGGNYWSHLGPPDYRDEDPVDGFYDQTYKASFGAYDFYPRVSPRFEPCDSEGPVTSNVTVDPSVVQVGGTVMLHATVDDSDTGGSNIASAEYTLDGGETWNEMGGTWDQPTVVVDSSFFAPLTAGVYEVCVRGTDALDNVGEQQCTFLVAYDPSGGFVTGGGWIDSPLGAYADDETLTGKANFGFVSKYKKGASVPTGNTEFQFKVADLNFKSTSYDWLVIAGARAKFKGEGTINGDGNYGFMLTAADSALPGGGESDTFRIKIWDKDNGDVVVYDNQMGAEDDADATTALAGGSIVIHKAK